jgi:pimeloyl-ACP methyl ester carboxylesterase
VAAALDRFTEGFETADLQDAAAFLARPAPAAATPQPAPPPGRDAPIRYAKSGDLNIAYQVTGDGPVDLVLVPGFVSHLERDWDEPRHAHFLERLGGLARLIRFDKRGTGLSDRPPDLPDLEARMDDVRAVMDAAGSHRAILLGYSEGGPMSILFASTYPQRTRALVLFGAFAARIRSDGYPWAPTEAEREASARRVERDWGLEEVMRNMCPSADEAMARWWGARGRAAASPGAARALVQMNTRIDVQGVLSAVRVPTLVLHRRGDREVTIEEGRYVADRIPGARLVELSGIDHFVAIDPDQIVDEVERFVTGLGEPAAEALALASVVAVEAERSPDLPPELFGDMRWTRDAILGDIARRYTGEVLRTPGQGELMVFDGPARAIRAGLDLVARFADVGLSGRAAVHTGPVDRDAHADGDAAAVAERLLALAGPEEMLVTGTTRSLVEGSELRFDRREAPSADVPELYVVRPFAPAPTPPIATV